MALRQIGWTFLKIKKQFCGANNLNEALAVHYLVLFADLLQFANLKSKQISHVHFRSVGNNIWPLLCSPFWPIFLIAKANCKGFKSFFCYSAFYFQLIYHLLGVRRPLPPVNTQHLDQGSTNLKGTTNLGFQPLSGGWIVMQSVRGDGTLPLVAIWRCAGPEALCQRKHLCCTHARERNLQVKEIREQARSPSWLRYGRCDTPAAP